MNLVQNTVALVMGYLLAVLLVEAGIPQVFLVRRLSRMRRPCLGDLVVGLLWTSWMLSLFFPNLVVALSLIPRLREMTSLLPEGKVRWQTVTPLAMAVVLGANIGGMGSLTGATSNLYLLGFLALHPLPGQEQITFVSWLLFGVPLTSLLILGLSPLLRAWSRGGDLKGVILPGREAMGRGQRRRLLLFAFFFSALLLLSALNMVAERPQVHRLLDKLLLGLLLLLAGVLFLLPRGAGPFARGVWRNSLRLGLTLLWLPRLLGASLRHDLWGRKGKGGVSRRLLLREWEGWWRRWPLGEAPDLDRPSRYSLLSLHRMVMDLPLVGLALMILVIGLLLLLVRWGDDPLTPVWDGWLIRWLQELARSSLSLGVTGWPLLLVLIGLTVLATEVLNNSTVMLSLLGLLAAVPEKVLGEVPLLFWFLAVTLASTAAFMGPLASPVNAVVVGGLPGVRLRRMMLWGLVANGICAVWLWGCMGLLVWL